MIIIIITTIKNKKMKKKKKKKKKGVLSKMAVRNSTSGKSALEGSARAKKKIIVFIALLSSNTNSVYPKCC